MAEKNRGVTSNGTSWSGREFTPRGTGGAAAPEGFGAVGLEDERAGDCSPGAAGGGRGLVTADKTAGEREEAVVGLWEVDEALGGGRGLGTADGTAEGSEEAVAKLWEVDEALGNTRGAGEREGAGSAAEAHERRSTAA